MSKGEFYSENQGAKVALGVLLILVALLVIWLLALL
jgi:hypothetical protein